MKTQKTKTGRIQILTDQEADELYSCPVLNQAEREEYLSFDSEIERILAKLEKTETRVYLILLIGYFRAKPVVPKFKLRDVKQDVEYIYSTYFPDKKPKYSVIKKSTRATLILKMYSILGFDKFSKRQHQQALIERLRDVATICTDPKYIFDECLAFFGQKRIGLVGYTTLQNIITNVLASERQRTEDILSCHMPEGTQAKLHKILHTTGILNNLSAYKGSAKDFSPSQLDKEIGTHNTIKEVYPDIKQLIEKLGLSQGNLNYYASIIHHQSVYKIRRYPKWQGMLYIACYLFFRYQETNDKLVIAFQYVARKQREAAKAAAKQRIADDLEVIRDKLKSAGNILKLFVDDNISDQTEFGDIRQDAFAVIPKEEIQLISQHLHQNNFDKILYEWQFIDTKHKKISNSMRSLFMVIDIDCDPNLKLLASQLTISKSELNKDRKITTVDQRLLRSQDKEYLVENNQVNTKRFEYYLYQKVAKLMNNNSIYVAESAENKRLEDDLIPQVERKNQDHIIQKTGLIKLNTPIDQTLTGLLKTLRLSMKNVGNGINDDANDFVKRQPRIDQLTWTLANKRWKDDIENPIYTQVQHMGIIEIMDFVNKKTGYLNAFKNIGSKKHSIKAKEDDLLACIFGNGSNYGLHHMSSISDRSIGVLRAVNDGYIRPETTSDANDVISDALAVLPIFKHYTINEPAPFGSIDGQKFSCRINTFRARYSAKYFRKGKGVSALTLVSNHVPLKTKTISPNEYEGHHAFDLLYNNTSDIQPKTLATDTHGVNNVNFAILDLFGYQFAPRYAKFKNAFNDMFEVEYGDKLTLQLKKPINTSLIKREWNNIQWIICSLSRKTATQSTIIKKLSNNKKNSRTLAALHEYDRLIKCQYMLDYVDSKILRQFVQQALNRGEAYHQLRRAIASINGNQFKGGQDYQIDQWNDCARIIANCIIYYNSALLSGLIEKFENENNPEIVNMIAKLSPVAWRHIQLAGNYIFGIKKNSISVDRLLENLDPLVDEEETLVAA
ncbi:MAG: transposase [Osedax symbiont Rs2]|nr:MAG: transposase [Osedax symbiont Rs2]EPJ43064.1 MAG: transposase [Osedax symbiont Rs1]